MIHFVFTPMDRRYVFLKYDTELEYTILKENLMPLLNQVDPICYLPSFRGDTFTQDFIWEYVQPSGQKVFYAPVGMWYPIWQYFKKNNIEFDGLDKSFFKNNLPHSFDEIKQIIDSWGLSRNLRPYQYDAIYKILQYKISLSELATRAGKTLMSYCVFRYAMTYLGVKKILMIVPGIDLVKQGFEDFKEYGEFFNAECIWSGGKVVQSSNITIATYQSLVNYLDPENKNYNPKFFDNYDCVFIDEAHRAKAVSIKKIITQPFMKTAKLVFGMTGTLPKPFTIDAYTIHCLLGAKIQTIKAAELMEQGYLSLVKIYQHHLHYTSNKAEQVKLWCRCAEYQLSDFIFTDANKKDRVPLDNPKFLLAYEKLLPNAFEQARNSIFKNNELSETKKYLKYKNTLLPAITSSAKANILHNEIMMVHFMERRITYLIDILKECPNNTLILAQHTEYIKYVANELRIAFPDRPIVEVYGSSKQRKYAKTIFKENDNAIMVANYAIMGTGITLNNLCYGVLFESFKSDVINRQSIGRGLGLSDIKDTYILHDIVDIFDNVYATKTLYNHAVQRQNIYKEQQFPFEIIDVNI